MADCESEGIQPDDPIDPTTRLYRLVHPVHYSHQADGSIRLRDTAFKNPSGGRGDMSIQLGDKMDELDIAPADLVASKDEPFGVAAISAQTAIENDQALQRTPKPNDPAHGDVIGDKPGLVRKTFVREACWAVQPPAAGEQEPSR